MTDHEHAATGPGPGSGPRPSPGAGRQDAAPAAGAEPGAGAPADAAGDSRAPGHADARDNGGAKPPHPAATGKTPPPGSEQTDTAGETSPPPSEQIDATGETPPPPSAQTDATGEPTPPPSAQTDTTGERLPQRSDQTDTTDKTPPQPSAQTDATGEAPPASDQTDPTGEAPPPASEHTDTTDKTPPPPSDPAAAAGSSAPPDDPGGRADVTGPPHKFRRDRRHKVLAGVCAGLGRQCDMDPVIFRITLAVLSATGGIGLLFYGFAWLFVPYDDEDENEVRKLLTGRVDGQALTAVLFALVGCGVFLTMLGNGGVLTFAVVLSLLLAGAGYWSRHRGAPGPDPLAAQAVADAPPEPQAPPVPVAFPSWWRDPIIKDGTHIGGTGYLWGPHDSRDLDVAAAINISLGTVGSAREEIRTARVQPPKPRGPRWIGGWIFLLALLAAGLGTGATWEENPLGTSLQTGLACALVVIGAGIAVSAFLGRTGAGSIFLGVVTAALLAGSAALPRDIDTHWMRTTWRPATVAEVRQQYDVGSGVGTLDLTRLDVAEGQTVATRADVGAGRIRVLVPEDVTVRLSIDVGVGDIQLPGDEKKDVDVAPGKHKEVTLPPARGVEDAGTIDLDLQVGVGQAEVSRAAS